MSRPLSENVQPLTVKMPSQGNSWFNLPITRNVEPRFCWSHSGHYLSVDGTLIRSYNIANLFHAHPELDDWLLNEAVEDTVDYASNNSWDPTDDGFACASVKDGKIWLKKIRGERNQLTFGAGRHRNPQWSSDGHYLAYVVEEQDFRCEVMNLDSRRVHRLCGQRAVGWSPDGRRFACISTSRRNVNGGDSAFLVFDRDSVARIDPPPGETRLLDYATCAAWIGDSQIALGVPVTGGCGRTHVFNLDTHSLVTDWLPTANFVLSSSWPRRVAGQCSIFAPVDQYLVWAEATQDSFHVLKSTVSDKVCTAHGWSPKADKILFTRVSMRNPASSEIWVVNAGDTGLQHLADGYSPKWSPDGRYIAFLRLPQEKTYELWVMEVT